MNCSGIREVAYEYLKGWCEPDLRHQVEAHLAQCPSCTAELRSDQSSLSLLHSLPEIEAAPETWTKIEKSLPPRLRRVAFKPSIRWAAAAGILVAVFVGYLAMPRTRALPVVVETRKALTLNEPFHAEQFSTITIPDVGTLKVNQGALLRFETPRLVSLERGELFAEIEPSGRGFEVRIPQATARVHGTRFGVRTPETVYVVEGRVEVTSSRGRLALGPNQAAVGSRLLEVGPGDYLQWLTRHERPTLRLRIDPRDQTTITPGSPLKWNLILETESVAPLYLGDLNDLSQFLSLSIDGRAARLDPERAAVRSARGPNGRVRVDVSHPCLIECAVDPELFPEKGTARVTAVFTSGTNAPPDTWVGILQSNPIHVEVK